MANILATSSELLMNGTCKTQGTVFKKGLEWIHITGEKWIDYGTHIHMK